MFDKYSLIDTAWAQAADAAAKQPSVFETLIIPLGGFFLIMFFLVILPQQRKAKEHASMLVALKPGDEVVTSGGILGRIKSVAEGFVTLEIGGNTNVKVLKSHVTGLSKPKEATAKA